jgi:GH25 family lysozyme M1 (1,4-beta-N-acetylmuramidase)
MSKILGIDVSEFQGNIDWAKVKAAGIKYAIIRAGYGRNAVDEKFHANAKGAVKAGIPIGVYWFSYALNTTQAIAEAKKCLDTIADYDVTLPVFFDFEYDTVNYASNQGVTLGKQAFNDHAVAFCDTIQAAGYKAGVYYNLDYYNRFVDKSRLSKYVQWYAQYNTTADVSNWAIWQYSSSGTVSGISGRVDMDYLADESLLSGGVTVQEGWKQNSTGWWYQNADGSYPHDAWKKIDGAWYWFDSEGYCVTNQWQWYKNQLYYLGSDGAMVTSKNVKINADGELVPV